MPKSISGAPRPVPSVKIESGTVQPAAPSAAARGTTANRAVSTFEATPTPAVSKPKAVGAVSAATPTAPGELPVVGEYDYVIVGSGAGGAPLAAELAKKGYKVCVLEAGSGAEDINEVVPSMHALASEGSNAAKFFVGQDPKLDAKNKVAVPDKGIDKPRGWGVGGSPNVNAMITILPQPEEWEAIAQLTGDPDWKPENMRKIWETSVEHNDYQPVLKALDSLGQAIHLNGLQNVRGHGFDGWLHTQMPGLEQAGNLAGDQQLSKILFETVRASTGLSGTAGFLERLNHRFDMNDPAISHGAGLAATPTAIQDGVRSSPREYLLETQRKCQTGEFKGSIDIKSGNLATKIEFDKGDPPRASGVQLLAGEHLYAADNLYNPLAKGTPARVLAKNEVILSAGTFNTPQLLMLSGIGPKDALNKIGVPVKVDRPGVGTNVQDRIEVGVVSQMENPFKSLESAKFLADPNKDPEFKKWLETNGGLYSTNGAAVAVAFKSDPKLDHPDTYIFGVPGDFHGYYPGYSQDLEVHKDRFTFVVLQQHQNNHAGKITLESADPTKPPKTEMNAFADPGAAADVEATAKAVEWVRMLNTKIGTKAEIVPGPDVKTHDQLVEWVKENAWGHHPSGSAPMGAADDPNAVVNSNFEVIGTKGLRVVDASTFKTIPGLFPVADLYVMSELAAQKIGKSAAAEGKLPVADVNKPAPLWGADKSPSAAQRIALVKDLYDAQWGNKDGLANDGGPGKAAWLQDAMAHIPLVKDLPGMKDWDSPRMQGVLKAVASKATLSPAGEAVIPPSYREFYKAVKALQATRADFPLQAITEGFVKADDVGVTDPVTGKTTPTDHQLFYQRWNPPPGAPKGDVVVISPAYQATGRQWTMIAADLARKGNTVLVMDNEYAGLSKGSSGKFTGDSLAAGVALMTTEAEALRKKEGLPGKIRVLGESLSAGTAMTGLALAYDGKIDLQGRALPKDQVYVGMINPYLGKASNPLVENADKLLGKVGLALPAIPTNAAFTNVYRDADARQRFDLGAQLEHIEVHPEGAIASTDHLQHALEAMEKGTLKLAPNLTFGMLRTTQDASIDRSQTDRLEKDLGPAITHAQRIDGLKDHALVLNTKLQDDIVNLALASPN